MNKFEVFKDTQQISGQYIDYFRVRAIGKFDVITHANAEAERLNTMHRYYEKLVTKLDRLVTEIEDLQQDYPQEVEAP